MFYAIFWDFQSITQSFYGRALGQTHMVLAVIRSFPGQILLLFLGQLSIFLRFLSLLPSQNNPRTLFPRLKVFFSRWPYFPVLICLSVSLLSFPPLPGSPCFENYPSPCSPPARVVGRELFFWRLFYARWPSGPDALRQLHPGPRGRALFQHGISYWHFLSFFKGNSWLDSTFIVL